jgi:hypothetical protein
MLETTTMATKKISPKQQKKINENRIQAAYQAGCSGIQVNLMDIGKIFKVGETAIAEGADDAVLQQRIRTFVDSIRQN